MGVDDMKIKVNKGLDDLIMRLDRLAGKTDKIARGALGEAAKVSVEAVKDAIEAIPETPEGKQGLPKYAAPGTQIRGATSAQKEDLINSVGIAPFKNNGSVVNTSIGFDGYGSIPTKQYPGGVPNALLMRSIESGTSFREKTPVIRKAHSKIKAEAVQAAERKAKELINNIMK